MAQIRNYFGGGTIWTKNNIRLGMVPSHRQILIVEEKLMSLTSHPQISNNLVRIKPQKAITSYKINI